MFPPTMPYRQPHTTTDWSFVRSRGQNPAPEFHLAQCRPKGYVDSPPEFCPQKQFFTARTKRTKPLQARVPRCRPTSVPAFPFPIQHSPSSTQHSAFLPPTPFVIRRSRNCPSPGANQGPHQNLMPDTTYMTDLVVQRPADRLVDPARPPFRMAPGSRKCRSPLQLRRMAGR